MTFNQNYKQHPVPQNSFALQQLNQSSLSSLNTQLAGNSTSQPLSTSTSGLQSDWIVFEPDRADILSNSNAEGSHEGLLYTDDEEQGDIEEDDDDDDDSLLESLETNDMNPSSLNELNLASGSSGNYTFHANDYAQSLQNDDFINTRIDCWRKEQAKVLIDDLYGMASTLRNDECPETATGASSNDLLSSWGVEEDTVAIEHRASVKKFYGDDLLRPYTPWERSKISKVSKSLSTSLKRDPIYSTHYSKEASFLYQLSTNANKYTIQDSYSLMNEGQNYSGLKDLTDGLFWEQDLRSVQSSITTNSVVLGNLALDVF